MLMLWHRVLTAVVGIPVALYLVYRGTWMLGLLVALLALLGLRELYRLLALRERTTIPWLGYPLALLVIAMAAASPRPIPVSLRVLEAVLLAAGFAISAWWLSAPQVSAGGARLFGTIAAHIYVPQLFSYVVRIRQLLPVPMFPRGLQDLFQEGLPAGVCLVVMVLAIIWGMDTFAYAVGRTLGRHKLCPSISPGKTVEGALGGFLAAALIGGAFAYWLILPSYHGLMLGALLGIVGQAGDLFESKLKRLAGVKDSGAILPGHGGALDRFDSLLFCAPVAYFYLTLVVLYHR
jgi:phosphatidate cytidylyltransferase